MELPPHPYVQAVDRFFDRAERMLPRRAPLRMPLIVSFVVSFLVFGRMQEIIIADRKEQRRSSHAATRDRWMLFSVVNVVACLMLRDFLFDKLYFMSSYRVNMQHYVNLPWLKAYMDALRPRSSFLTL